MPDLGNWRLKGMGSSSFFQRSQKESNTLFLWQLLSLTCHPYCPYPFPEVSLVRHLAYLPPQAFYDLGGY